MKTPTRISEAESFLGRVFWKSVSHPDRIMKGFFWSVLSVALMLIPIASRSAEAEVQRPDLAGVVKSKNGQPISGATAFIYTAGPKLGVGFL
jgi:hypothetical protein